MVEILVTGEAVERAAAERATVTVQSRWQADAPEAAMTLVAKAHSRVSAEARAFAESGAVDTWHADRVWVSHHREWVGEGQPQRLVFTASASVTATFVDVEALGTWIGELGAEQVHEVGGIAWSLAEGTERELASRARSRAIADAVARAADYAEAAGLGAPVVRSIREPGVEPPRPLLAKRQRGVESMVLGAADAGGAVELAAGDIEVQALVEVGFSAEAASRGD
ncbi:SIMPL domain-containing protein [Agrococcus sp. SCSIO52902]|uniref:SIMPL domain-containing protein n=1 Tax=Agrococcus sp. SCSIO52902 TaxID=2933290 RepID=UPI001FF144E9|nr:SIMPL domain-containing protein [Agrococcus sp. SCSIO52902]UOW00145.1 SIMPL domain-containing protein [Agrococcus sp. SCSIO52902]